MITQAQLQHVLQWLREKTTGRGCPWCGHGQFTFSDRLLIMHPMDFVPDEGNRWDKTKAAAFVSMSCGRCGAVHLFSAKQLGLVVDSPAPVGNHSTDT